MIGRIGQFGGCMYGKREFDRANYEHDEDFERAIDAAAQRKSAEEKRSFLFSLLRECRGCGNQPTYETVEIYGVRQSNRSVMACKSCQRTVPLPFPGSSSLGRLVTLWNTTPLTIEGVANVN